MPTLDVHGKIAAAQMCFYLPIAISTIYLVFYYGFRRDAGWLFLFLFSSARISDGALIVVGELTRPTKINLFVAAYTLQASALGLLLLSTIGFIGLAGQSTYSEISRVSLILRTTGFLVVSGTAISAAGGGLAAAVATSQNDTQLVLRRMSAGIFAIIYIFLFLVHFGCRTYHYQMRSYRRKLLCGLIIALPFLGVRVTYAILSSWSSRDLLGASLSKSPVLSRYNPVSGKWAIQFFMSSVMEYIVSMLYLLFSTVLARRHK